MLATNAGLLTPVLGDPSPWTPQRLYLNNESGVWYDPGDLTAEKVAWRRNLYLYSEPANATGYTATNVTFGTIAQFSFLASGGNGVTLLDATANRELRQTFTLTAGITYTLSFYVYVGAGVLPNQGSGSYRDFTITRDNADVTNYALISYQAIGGGVYRAVHSWTHTGTGASISIRKYSGLSTATQVDCSGLQLEVGTTASAYQRITDFTSDFLAAFPTHALYQDAAGTTPVTVLGQPVGLALDKSRGALANIGTTVLSNGDFASGTGWTAGTGWSIGSGVATKTAGTASVLSQAVTLTIPGTYRLIYTMTRSAGTLTPRLTGGTTVNATARTASGTYTEYVTTVTGNTTFEFSADASFAGTVDNVAFQLVPGVHAIQPTSASRPALDARVNLLTYTEQFDNAAWAKINGGVALAPVVTANAGVAPDGTTTADRIVFNLNGGTTSNDFSEIERTQNVPFTYNVSIWLRTEDLSTKVFTFRGPANFTSITVTGVWQRFILPGTANGTNAAFGLRLRGGAEATSASATVLAWGADLRLAADAAYPYQRVTTATDYADVGVPRALLFDGFDDSLYTASTLDLSGTDKVTVWAGVYKNSDAAFSVLAELTANAGSNNGGFAVIAPGNSPTRYQWVSRGTAAASAVTSSASFSAPHSAVFSGVGDIAADVCALRINGVQVATDSTDQGTGNYANAVTYIGRRNNASNPFNGKLYSGIVRGGVTDAATLAITERYVGSRMDIVL